MFGIIKVNINLWMCMFTSWRADHELN